MTRKSAPSRPKKNPTPPPRRNTLLKGALWAFVCLWMFVLGLLVGRGTAPVRFDVERLQDRLAGLKAATVDETAERYRVAFRAIDQEMNLGFHEALKNEETEIPSTLSPAEPQTPEEIPPAAASEEKAEEAAIPKKTRNLEFQKPANRASKTWTIQVAATKDEHQGKNLLLDLYQIGYKAYLTTVAIPDQGTWYRVRIGGYESREAAEADMEQLEEKRFSPMIIAP